MSICAHNWNGEKCNQPSVGNSKYCREHRAESRKRFKEMVAQQAKEREERNELFAKVFEEAYAAGIAAANACTPAPMVVQQHVNPLDDNSPVIKEYEPVVDGVCGFGYIQIRDGRSAAAKYAKNAYGARKGYHPGVVISIHEYNQSYEKKMAHAHAMAAHLNNNGIACYAWGRLD